MFSSLKHIFRYRIAGSHARFRLKILRNCQTFLKWLYYFTFPPAECEGSGFSIPSTTVATVSLISVFLVGIGGILLQFQFAFPRCWASSHVLTASLMKHLIFCPPELSNLSYKHSFYIWIQVLYQIEDLQIFSHSLWVVFSFSKWCLWKGNVFHFNEV